MALLVIKNIYDAAAEKVDALAALNRYDALEDKKFNTGLATLGNPHIDEVLHSDAVLLEDKDAWKAKHIASIRFYKSSSYAVLNPGDELKIETKSAEETVYYTEYATASDLLEVTEIDEAAITRAAVVAEEEAAEVVLDRTTGIGDDENVIDFDSEAVTADMNAAVAADEEAPAEEE